MLITFEGAEGAGKSTHSLLLRDWLANQGFDPILTKQPGGTLLGQQLRNIVCQGSGISPTAQLLLFAADRCIHVEQVIIPALNAGKIVICDRYIDSGFSYQYYAGQFGIAPESQFDLSTFHTIQQISTRGLMPNLTFWLDIPIEYSLERAKQRGKLDQFESKPIEFHQRVYEAYSILHYYHPERILRIDATKTITEITVQIRNIVATHLGLEKPIEKECCF